MRCSVCKIEKTEENFYINRSKSTGRNSECKPCTREYRKLYYLNNKDKLDDKAKQWRLDNPEQHKNNEMMRKYGITVDEYNSMLYAQEYQCAICGTSAEENKQDLAVDHCHNTGTVRGLLCKACNRGLGMFKDDTDLLNKALEYLDA